ncbi:DUF3644 domain-containing protein [Legionella pneumophila]
MSSRYDKAIKAFKFMENQEKSGQCFKLEDLSRDTGWKISTIKTYINKQWRDFVRYEQDNLYSTNGLLTISQEIFIKIHSQKLKYRTHLYEENESLLIKSRQFALLAVYVYNSPYSEFRTYGFIVNIIIAWTALFHAIFQKDGKDFFYKNHDGSYQIINNDKRAWELSMCLDTFWNGVENPIKSNLKFLIGLRNRIEHRDLPLIDLKTAGHCQACANNFEKMLGGKFGDEYSLNKNITLAIQLSRSHEQKKALKDIQQTYFDPIFKFMDDFESQLPVDFLESPEYRVSYFLTPKITSKRTSADLSIEFSDSEVDAKGERQTIFLKEREKEKFKPKQIVQIMSEEGYKKFSIHYHTKLWKSKKAKNSNYGVKLSDGSWYWYANWVDVVREYCKNNQF